MTEEEEEEFEYKYMLFRFYGHSGPYIKNDNWQKTMFDGLKALGLKIDPKNFDVLNFKENKEPTNDK